MGFLCQNIQDKAPSVIPCGCRNDQVLPQKGGIIDKCYPPLNWRQQSAEREHQSEYQRQRCHVTSQQVSPVSFGNGECFGVLLVNLKPKSVLVFWRPRESTVFRFKCRDVYPWVCVHQFGKRPTAWQRILPPPENEPCLCQIA